MHSASLARDALSSFEPLRITLPRRIPEASHAYQVLGTPVLGTRSRRSMRPYLRLLLLLRLGDHPLRCLARHFFVALELATQSCAAMGHRLQGARVEVQLRLRNDRPDARTSHVGRSRLGAEDLRASRREVAEHVA